MTLMIGLHLFFLKCLKNVGQDSVSGIVQLKHNQIKIKNIY
jgi:hypothetical protein